jgi:hypothetical protein
MPYEMFGVKIPRWARPPTDEVEIEVENRWNVDDQEVEELEANVNIPAPVEQDGIRHQFGAGGIVNPLYGGMINKPDYHNYDMYKGMYQSLGTVSTSTTSTNYDLREDVRKLTKAVEDLTRIITEMKLREFI